METSEITEDVAEFFNSEFGDDLKNMCKIHDVIDRLTKCEETLESEISPRNRDPSRVAETMKVAEEALENIKKLREKWENLENSATCEIEKMRPVKDDFYSKIKELKEIESLNCYIKWILKIEDENFSMEEALKSNDIPQMVDIFSNFKEFWTGLCGSECKNLVTYVKKTMQYWYDVLKDKLGSEFQTVLNSLHWPVLSNIRLPANQAIDVLLKFKQLFLSLCKISLPYVRAQDVKDSVEDASLLLPLQLMLQPLQKRFVFHFMGKKPTNRLDKPEWYLTQILTWISDHSLFLEKIVQPILENEGMTQYNAQSQMMKGLVRLAILRLKSDMKTLLDDDRLLSHTIDEILMFSRELKNQGYPLSYPDILHILTSEPCFTRWRSLEHQGALEKMDRFLSMETSWKSRYQDESGIDDLHVPESAELFITLLLTMTERYSSISEKDCQVSFLELQLELLDDFRLRLHQLSQCEMQEAIQPNFCGIMNAIHYITMVLEEWNNLPFFLQLHTYRKKKLACEAIMRDLDKPPQLSMMKSREARTAAASDEEFIEASVFDEAIGLLNHMQNDFLQTMCDRVILDIKAKSRPYRKEKWFCMPVVQDKKSMEISLAAYPMLEVVSTSLNSLQELLAKPLFTKIWLQIASELNCYLYEEVVAMHMGHSMKNLHPCRKKETDMTKLNKRRKSSESDTSSETDKDNDPSFTAAVILQNSFSEGGAAQLQFDMVRNLFPIFGSYTVKPENYFRLVKDSCTLLNLSSAPAMLLRETMKHEDGFKSKSNALEELGVFSLTPSQALIILSQRNHMSV